MVKKPAVLVVGQKQYRVRPVLALQECVDAHRHRGLSHLEVRWRMLIPGWISRERGLEEDHLRKSIPLQIDEVILDQRHLVDVAQKHRSEQQSDGAIGEIILPGDSVFIQLIENRELSELLLRGVRVVPDVPKSGSGEQEE